MNAAALDAEYNAEINRDPFSFRLRVAVSAPAVALIVVTNDLQKFGGIVFEAIAISANIRWAGSDSAVPVNAVGSVSVGG